CGLGWAEGGGGCARKTARDATPPPLEATDVGERSMEDPGGHVLRIRATGSATCDEGVDAVEVPLVEIGEADRVDLGGLDQAPLVVVCRGGRCRSLGRHHFTDRNDRERAKVTPPDRAGSIF